tara:strand:- start:10532 stop:10879 length:348 start_codon:yes stop_codon:yes gene_type:complete
MIDDLSDTICDMQERLHRHPDGDFTIEPGSGQTYHTGNPTLYFHHQYGKGSVLEGQSCRNYLGAVCPAGKEREFIDSLPDALKKITHHIAGTTHRDVDQMTAHLSDGPDQDPEDY